MCFAEIKIKDEVQAGFIKRMNVFAECTVAIAVTWVAPENFLIKRTIENVKTGINT